MSNRHHSNRRRVNSKGKDSSPLTQDPQDVMSTAMRLQWNIRVLQRHDPQITTIVDQFTYAVLYRYEHDRWIKRGVEGSMFVYTRTEPPRHGFCILNREGAGNFVQPLRRGDDMEITDDYIIYRPADVGRDDYESFIGIWTADVVERKRLSEFMLRIQQHIAESDVPYSPVLLHQPLEKPEDAALPLIVPLPPPSHNTTTPAKKNRRGGPKQAASSHPDVGQPSSPNQTFQNDTTAHNPEVHADDQHVSIDSLFAKFTQPPGLSNSQQEVPAQPEQLRGPALLQTMFASAAAQSGAGSTGGGGLLASSTFTTTHSTSVPGPRAPAGNPAVVAHKPETSTVVAIPTASANRTIGTKPDGIAQGNMLKELLGIPVQPSAPTSSETYTTRPAEQPARAASVVPVRTPSIPPGFTPINEDEEQTPPRESRSRTSHNGNARPPLSESSPAPSMFGHPRSSGPERELVAYEFDDDAGVVSPWMNEPLQRPRLERVNPPSPSQFPKPRAVREKQLRTKKGGQGSPRPDRQSTPKLQYVPRNDNPEEVEQSLNRNAAADALIGVFAAHSLEHLSNPAVLSRDRFIQELLGLIHRSGGFADSVYDKYLEFVRSHNGVSDHVDDDAVVYLH
ncbi:hypothetical protein FRB99_006242 [Tulasnella sp. 403]|nr:hypothetical protein FRB99_006242 [Tulasnella sp. 403]